MNPQETQMDQDVINLAKSIRQTESGGNFSAKGASGESGAYQWMPDTWKAHAQEALGNPNAEMTPSNQNAVAYTVIKKWKDQGLNPAQIAAKWNSGSETGWENKVGINKAGVRYDVPRYVKSVTDAYQKVKMGGVVEVDPQNPSSTEGQEIPHKGAEVIRGFVKGAGDTLLGMARFGEGVANQTAGRVVSGVLGMGNKPLTPEVLGDRPSISGTPSAIQADEALKSQNKYQTAGKILETGAEFLIPGVGGKKVLDARKLARAGEDAIEIVAPKASKKILKDALKQGRTSVQGFFRSETMTPDQRTERAARAVEDLVKTGKMGVKKTASENANAVYEQIGIEAENLVKQLKERDIQLILQPEELTSLQQKVMQRISEDPDLVGNAGESASRMFNNYFKLFPKGKEITAEDLLKVRKQFDKTIASQSKKDIFDPAIENAKSIALRAIRQETNDLIAAKAPDVAVKESFSKQTALYDALDNIAEKGYKEIGTDIRGRYFQRHPYQKELVKGAIQGLVPLGILGAYAGSKATGE